MGPTTVILGDSIITGIFLRGIAEVHNVRGATFLRLLIGVELDHYIKDWSPYRLVIIHCGTNDIDNGNAKDILATLQLLIHSIQDRNSNIRIIVSSILPRPKDFPTTNPTIKRTNQVLQIWAQSQSNVRFEPTYRTYLYNGEIRKDQELFAKDDLHLNELGKWRLARLFKNIVNLFNNKRLHF